MRSHKHYGFTLIEVVVAISILAVIGLFTANALTRALSTKAKMQKEIDKTSTLRDALRVMERDINMAFNYKDVYADLWNQAVNDRKKNQNGAAGGVANSGSSSLGTSNTFGQQTQGSQNQQPDKYQLKDTKVWTQFIGHKEDLDFTSLSNVRMTEDQAISSQAEIGYHLKPCRRRADQVQISKCLWRRVSNYFHEDITKPRGDETVLLENVTEFKLRYLGPDKAVDEWVEDWSSGEGADDVTRGKFPYAVEITIEIKDASPEAKDKPLRMTTVASIRNPNNPPKDANQPGAGGTQNGSQTGAGTGTGPQTLPPKPN